MTSNESAASGEVDREYAGESAVELRNGTGERLGGEVAKSSHNGGELRWCSFGVNEGSH